MSNDIVDSVKNKNSGRVTTREFYDAILAQNEEAGKRELRTNTKIEKLTIAVTNITKQPQICQAYFEHINKRIDENKTDIKDNADDIKTSKTWDKLIALGSAIGTALGIAIKR